jgi:hypothetical protein
VPNGEHLHALHQLIAIAAQQMGWTYELEEPEEFDQFHMHGKNTYAHNFLPPAVLADLQKNKTKCKHFAFPTANSSHYFRPLNFHGSAAVDQHGPAPAATNSSKSAKQSS